MFGLNCAFNGVLDGELILLGVRLNGDGLMEVPRAFALEGEREESGESMFADGAVLASGIPLRCTWVARVRCVRETGPGCTGVHVRP